MALGFGSLPVREPSLVAAGTRSRHVEADTPSCEPDPNRSDGVEREHPLRTLDTFRAGAHAGRDRAQVFGAELVAIRVDARPEHGECDLTTVGFDGVDADVDHSPGHSAPSGVDTDEHRCAQRQ